MEYEAVVLVGRGGFDASLRVCTAAVGGGTTAAVAGVRCDVDDFGRLKKAAETGCDAPPPPAAAAEAEPSRPFIDAALALTPLLPPLRARAAASTNSLTSLRVAAERPCGATVYDDVGFSVAACGSGGGRKVASTAGAAKGCSGGGWLPTALPLQLFARVETVSTAVAVSIPAAPAAARLTTGGALFINGDHTGWAVDNTAARLLPWPRNATVDAAVMAALSDDASRTTLALLVTPRPCRRGTTVAEGCAGCGGSCGRGTADAPSGGVT